MQKNACWVFETVQIILIIISLICFTEKVYGSNPYSPNNIKSYNLIKKKIVQFSFLTIVCNWPLGLVHHFNCLIFVDELHMNFPIFPSKQNQRISNTSSLWYTYPIRVNFWSQNPDMKPVKNSNIAQSKSNALVSHTNL